MYSIFSYLLVKLIQYIYHAGFVFKMKWFTDNKNHKMNRDCCTFQTINVENNVHKSRLLTKYGQRNTVLKNIDSYVEIKGIDYTHCCQHS